MRFKLSLKYTLSIMIVLLVVMSTMFLVIYKKHEQMVMAQIDVQAKALFKQVVITRRWVADHGGVYVEKLPWVEQNPYLRNSFITDAKGKRYIKENPAMVTRQLSQYAEREKLYIFHITSLKLINPENAPDAFEKKALMDFEKKQKGEASTTERNGRSFYYRYIAPLYIEEACLECHSHQGYKIGDVRGAISISVPIDGFLAMMAVERRYMFGGMVVVCLTIILTLFMLTRRVIIAPIKKIQRQMNDFSKTGNVNIPLIETGDEIEDLSRSFRKMANDIGEYQGCLQEKIKTATRELTEKNEALAESSQSKSDFIAKTSHELRTPLTAIKGAMDYLSVKLAVREKDEEEDLIVFFEVIKKNADRLIRLVGNILDYERISMGTVEMNFKEANLKEVFQEIVAGFIPLAAKKNVSILTKTVDAPARFDEDRMKQVLTNLLSNALNFSPDSGNILVALECRDGKACGFVEDMGVRIPQGERENIFTQYYTRNVAGGTGLGLAICRGIIEAHGGEIGVEDSSLGGSRFWFRIPKRGKEQKGNEKTTARDR